MKPSSEIFSQLEKAKEKAMKLHRDETKHFQNVSVDKTGHNNFCRHGDCKMSILFPFKKGHDSIHNANAKVF